MYMFSFYKTELGFMLFEFLKKLGGKPKPKYQNYCRVIALNYTRFDELVQATEEELLSKNGIGLKTLSFIRMFIAYSKGEIPEDFFEGMDVNIQVNNQAKPVKCVEARIIFPNVKQAVLWLQGVKHESAYSFNISSNIRSALAGRTKTAYGYHWERVEVVL